MDYVAETLFGRRVNLRTIHRWESYLKSLFLGGSPGRFVRHEIPANLGVPEKPFAPNLWRVSLPAGPPPHPHLDKIRIPPLETSPGIPSSAANPLQGKGILRTAFGPPQGQSTGSQPTDILSQGLHVPRPTRRTSPKDLGLQGSVDRVASMRRIDSKDPRLELVLSQVH